MLQSFNNHQSNTTFSRNIVDCGEEDYYTLVCSLPRDHKVPELYDHNSPRDQSSIPHVTGSHGGWV